MLASLREAKDASSSPCYTCHRSLCPKVAPQTPTVCDLPGKRKRWRQCSTLSGTSARVNEVECGWDPRTDHAKEH